MKLTTAIAILTLLSIGGRGVKSDLPQHPASNPARQAAQAPRFEDFPAADLYKGKSAPVRLVSREARKYRTVIRDGAREAPNFAGHYIVVTWGCGAGCEQFAVVDAKTGEVFMPPFYIGPRAAVEGANSEPDEPLQFRADSKLLIVSGSRNEKGEGIYYYKWDGKRLALIKSMAFK